MSEHAKPTQDPVSSPFTTSDLKQFDADDAQAGGAIGKMLSLFFLYTVIAMSVAAYATYWWVAHSPLH